MNEFDFFADDGNGRLGLVVCREILLFMLKLKAQAEGALNVQRNKSAN